MHVRQSHERIDRQWCWVEFEEQSGVGRNRTVVDAVIPLHQSNGDHQRYMKAQNSANFNDHNLIFNRRHADVDSERLTTDYKFSP